MPDWAPIVVAVVAAVVGTGGLTALILAPRRVRVEERGADVKVTETSLLLVDRLERRLDDADQERESMRGEIRDLQTWKLTATEALERRELDIAELKVRERECQANLSLARSKASDAEVVAREALATSEKTLKHLMDNGLVGPMGEPGPPGPTGPTGPQGEDA